VSTRLFLAAGAIAGFWCVLVLILWACHAPLLHPCIALAFGSIAALNILGVKRA
jgi:hypothetical protein